MKIRIFTAVYPLGMGFEIAKDEPNYQYLANVLRVKIGRTVYFFNGLDKTEYEYTISLIDKKRIGFDFVNAVQKVSVDMPKICLVFAPAKNVAIENVIRQSTELGVSEFIPIMTERGVVKTLNYERIIKIATEACEQSERMDVPIMHEMTSLDKFLDGINIGQNLVFCDEAIAGSPVQIPQLQGKIFILIGAEGGFSDAERSKILSHNPSRLSLGRNILKADTACVCAVSLYINVC
jgi:16S rRNA (uracil1498-N3)-methyltransferase